MWEENEGKKMGMVIYCLTDELRIDKEKSGSREMGSRLRERWFLKLKPGNNSSHHGSQIPIITGLKRIFIRSKKVPAMAAIKYANVSIVRQAFGLLVILILLGVLIYSFTCQNFTATETHLIIDALYFCTVTM
ncbi:hypothetical protein NE237_031186 [Protea cynaroides]|uniref:Uncharacterized protein n=1 Tax=Protea cynaroides TaxID=273540 RepID=A0A9Q0L1R3_9MAGN|nr:hypothetical protein NE237_031186 [Protea cynaroides]